MLTISFYGAAGQVTGSKYFVRTSKSRGFLVDCGLFQGPRELRERNWHELPVHPGHIANIVLTHAHLDHTGYLPKLVKMGFKGPIYCTPATHEVTEFILRDSAKIQEEDAIDANRHGYSRHRPAVPLYSADDVEETLGMFHVINRKREKQLPDDISFHFFNAGHILGSNFVRVTRHNNEGVPTRILFSGDIGRKKPIYLNPKDEACDAEYVICESTYGDRLHHQIDPLQEFAEIIKDVIRHRKVLLIPAFAVDRAQEIIYCLNSLMRDGDISEIPTYVDSPMATGVTALYEKYCEEHTMSDEELNEPDKNPLSFDSLRFVRTHNDSKRLNDLKGPAIILSASGMASGGRIMHHLRNRLPSKDTLVLFTGFQAEGTTGRDLIEGTDSVVIHGERVPVQAEIRKLNSFSGHADQSEIIDWLRSITSARRIILTHGEEKARMVLKERIEQELRKEVYLPRLGETLDLETLDVASQ